GAADCPGRGRGGGTDAEARAPRLAPRWRTTRAAIAWLRLRELADGAGIARRCRPYAHSYDARGNARTDERDRCERGADWRARECGRDRSLSACVQSGGGYAGKDGPRGARALRRGRPLRATIAREAAGRTFRYRQIGRASCRERESDRGV